MSVVPKFACLANCMGQSREPFISLLLYHLLSGQSSAHAQHLRAASMYEHTYLSGTTHVVSNHTSDFDPILLLWPTCGLHGKRKSCFISDFEASNSVVWALTPVRLEEAIRSALKYLRWAGVSGRHSHTGWKNHRPQTRCSADCCEGKHPTAGQFMGTGSKKGSAMPQPGANHRAG